MDDRGLQGATPGQRDSSESGAQHDPLSNSVPADSSVSPTSAPQTEDEDPSERLSKLKLDLESGNVADTLREAASDLEKAQAMLREPHTESDAPPDASQPKRASATSKTKGLMRGSGRIPTGSGGENGSGDMGADGTGKQSARFFGLGAEGAKSVVYVLDPRSLKGLRTGTPRIYVARHDSSNGGDDRSDREINRHFKCNRRQVRSIVK